MPQVCKCKEAVTGVGFSRISRYVLAAVTEPYREYMDAADKRTKWRIDVAVPWRPERAGLFANGDLVRMCVPRTLLADNLVAFIYVNLHKELNIARDTFTSF